MEESYNKLRGLVAHTAYLFRNRYGGELQELIAEANLAFVLAYGRYDPNKGACMGTWIRYYVWRHLTEMRRRDRSVRGPMKDVYNEEVLAPQRFNVNTICAEVGASAAQAIRLILQNPNRRSPTYFVRVLADMGWTKGKIQRTLHEIKEVLQP